MVVAAVHGARGEGRTGRVEDGIRSPDGGMGEFSDGEGEVGKYV